jgi:hypothetical protein
MRRSSAAGLIAVVITLVMMLWSTAALAGQYKDMHGIPANAACMFAHSSPRNISTAMAMEVYEFVTAPGVIDGYRCCITSNATGQDLFVRLINLVGVPAASFQTAVNGIGCTAFVNLNPSLAFQCTVASGQNSPVLASAHYTLGVCRQ